MSDPILGVITAVALACCWRWWTAPRTRRRLHRDGVDLLRAMQEVTQVEPAAPQWREVAGHLTPAAQPTPRRVRRRRPADRLRHAAAGVRSHTGMLAVAR